MRDIICRTLLTYNFDYINDGMLGDGLAGADDMYHLVNLIKDIGYSGYQLTKTIGIIVLAIALLVAAVTLAISRNKKVAYENKEKVMRVIVGTCALFAFLGFITIVASIGGQINELDVIEPYTPMATPTVTPIPGKKPITTLSPEYYMELYGK